MSCPADEWISSSIPSPYICCETCWEAISIGWISFINCALMVENISRITFLAKYFCDGTAYNGQALLKSTGIVYNGKELRAYCYHFCYSACYFLVLWVAIIPLNLAFLHLSQCKLTCISFCHFSLYSLAFLSTVSSNGSNLVMWIRCKLYRQLLVLKF